MAKGLTAGPYRLPLYSRPSGDWRRWNLNLPRTFAEFPAKAKTFPAQAQKIPCYLTREIVARSLKTRRKAARPSSGFVLFPANFPVSREFPPGDGFAPDWLISQTAS